MSKRKNMQRRGLTVQNVLSYKPKVMDFEGSWLNSFGCPELSGSWLIWGGSGNGKTRFALKLSKYLCRFGRVVYNSLEEGLSLSMQNAIREVGMTDVSRRFLLLDKEPIKDLTERLGKQKSADIVIIDSLQYSGLNYERYKMLKDSFRGKLFIFVSHAEGKQPEGRIAKSIRFDSNVKIWIEGYKAVVVSRFGGGELFTIWDKGAIQYWGS
jgi:hypothetical protein